MSLKFKIYTEQSANNLLYQPNSSSVQSSKMIDKLTKKAPINVYLKQKIKDENGNEHNQYVGFIVPHWTKYLFVEDGWLKASSTPVIIQKINDIESIQNMSGLYLYDDVPKVKKVLKLKGLKSGYTPSIYVLDKLDNVILVEKYKLSKEDRMTLKLKKYKNEDQEQPTNDPM